MTLIVLNNFLKQKHILYRSALLPIATTEMRRTLFLIFQSKNKLSATQRQADHMTQPHEEILLHSQHTKFLI